jgi:hypothetical protein
LLHHENVRRLQIAMDDARSVRGFKRVANLNAVSDGLVDR